MTTLRTWAFDTDQLTITANAVKDQVIGQLCIDEVISIEQRDQCQASYAVIHTKPKWLTRWWSKWRKDDTWEYVLVKIDLEKSAQLQVIEVAP